jgi:hypothetical protein
MKRHRFSPTSAFSHAGLLPAVCSLVAVGATLAVSLHRSGELRADGAQRVDSDGDGLVDALEHVLGTSPTGADTDHDGYSDLEELARHTLATDATSTPTEGSRAGAPSLGMSCYWSHGLVHAVIALYSPDSNFHDLSVHIGYLAGGRFGEIGESALVGHSSLQTFPAHDRGASIAVIDFPFSPRAIHSLGSLTVFATAARKSTGIVTTADTAQLLDVGGVVVLCVPDHSAMNAATVGGGHSHGASAMIYVPLGDGDDPPMNWTQGAICYQQMEVVATTQASVTQEVTSAECQDGFDGACPSGCAGTVGSMITTVNAAALIGG